MRAQIVTVTAVRFGRILDKTRWTEPQCGTVGYGDCNPRAHTLCRGRETLHQVVQERTLHAKIMEAICYTIDPVGLCIKPRTIVVTPAGRVQ